MKLILIGGTPRTGKTTLAQKIASEFGSPWVSTDALEAVVHSYVPPEKEEEMFPKAAMRKKTNRNNDDMYNTFTIEEVVESYYIQANATREAITALATYAAKEGWSYVIEGYHVTPVLLSELKSQGLHFSSVVLINSNPVEAIERSRRSNVRNDWVRDNTEKEETFQKIADTIAEYSIRLSADAERFGIQTVDMHSDFETKFNDVYKLLTQNG